jgi:hypothetical protein
MTACACAAAAADAAVVVVVGGGGGGGRMVRAGGREMPVAWDSIFSQLLLSDCCAAVDRGPRYASCRAASSARGSSCARDLSTCTCAQQKQQQQRLLS